MASNDLANTSRRLIQQRGKMTKGIHNVAASVPVTMVTEAEIKGDDDVFLGRSGFRQEA